MKLLVNIDVEDLEAAIAFYRDGLGLSLGRRLFAGTVAELLGASSTIHLLAKQAGSTAVSRTALHRDYDRHWTPVHLDFEVDDVCAAATRAVGMGATMEGDIQTFAWGRVATLSDPFGHGFCLLQLVGAGYDAVSDSSGVLPGSY